MSKERKLVIWTGKSGKIELEVSFRKEILQAMWGKKMSIEEENQMREKLDKEIPEGPYKIEM
jgi:hypothetical protein